jgi:hypothetical protein
LKIDLHVAVRDGDLYGSGGALHMNVPVLVIDGERALHAVDADRSTQPIDPERGLARHLSPNVHGGAVFLLRRQGVGVFGVRAAFRNRNALQD